MNMIMTNRMLCHYTGAIANASTMDGWHNDYTSAECEHSNLELDNLRMHLLPSDGQDIPTAVEYANTGQPVDVQTFHEQHLEAAG